MPVRPRVDVQTVASYAMTGASSDGYGSTATPEAVEDYLKLAARLFGEREQEARCDGARCRDLSGI
jgi:hypothetical protein